MSIRPPFADAILSGEKRFEFRRGTFAHPVATVVVYVTTPVCRVVAEFDVIQVISASPVVLWRRTRARAGIRREQFFEYFRDKDIAHAIEIGEVRKYESPCCPMLRFGVRPPQSYVYLHEEQ